MEPEAMLLFIDGAIFFIYVLLFLTFQLQLFTILENRRRVSGPRRSLRWCCLSHPKSCRANLLWPRLQQSTGCTRASGRMLLAHTFALPHISEGKQSLSVWTKASLTTLFVLVVVWRKELMILHFEYILTEGNFNVWTWDGKREVASTTYFTSFSFRKGKIFFGSPFYIIKKRIKT